MPSSISNSKGKPDHAGGESAFVSRIWNRPIFAYVAPPLILLLLNFNPNRAKALKNLETPGTASYDIPNEVATPTERLVDMSFSDAIRRFDDKPLVVLLGNSTIQGVGTLDRRFFNIELAKGSNIINAGLQGESLPASTSLALSGLTLAYSTMRPPRVDVFVVYPTTRLYTWGDCGSFCGAAAELCQKYQLGAYLPACARFPHAMASWRREWLDMQNEALSYARCLMTQNEFFDSLKFGTWHCQNFFDPEWQQAGYLHELHTHQGLKTLDRKALIPILKEAIATFTPRNARINLDHARASINALELFLKQRRVAYRINFIFISAPPQFNALLTTRERDYIRAGQRNFLFQLHHQSPQYRGQTWSFGPDDFFDESHLNESGLRKLANNILKARG